MDDLYCDIRDSSEISSLLDTYAPKDTAVMTRTATQDPDQPYHDSYINILSPSDLLTSSSSSPASSYSSNHSVSSTGRKKKQSKRKPIRKMDSEELQHVSDLSASTESNPIQPAQNDNTELNIDCDKQIHNSNSRSRKSSCSSIRVEIPDIWGDESVNFTTSTLRVCKEQVLRPYWGLLVFIGWRGIKKESVNGHLRRWKVLNVLYTTTIVMLLLYTYLYEILACEWKLDIHGAKHAALIVPANTTTSTTTTPLPTTNNVTYLDAEGSYRHFPAFKSIAGHRHHHLRNVSETHICPAHNEGCHHIITTYLIPNILHLVAYVLGLYYFRMQENEQLYALMEKVFLQATPFQARTASQHKMIVRLRMLLVIGSIWVLFTVLVQCLYLWAFDFPELPLFSRVGRCGYWIMLFMELLGRTVFNSVILAIVMNYVTQCEMIKFYVRGLTTRMLEKSTDLKAAMKDLLLIRHSVSLLNGVMSKMTSLVTFIVAELSIIGVCILIMNDNDNTKIWIYRSLFPLGWVFMLIFPLWQAARVNSIIFRIHKISLEMRVFGYKGASILDLDSFLQFVTLIKPKAKLFHLPMMPAYLISAVVLVSFIFLILVQTGSIDILEFQV